MGWTVPPPPLSKEEYDRRYSAGARTLEELDPEFCKWLEQGRKARLFTACMIFLAMLAGLVGAIWFLIRIYFLG